MKTFLKTSFCFTLTAILAMSVVCANAYESITVDKNSMNIVVDGERVYADNFVFDNTTYVPLRRIAEMLGKKVEWNPEVYGAFISDSDKVEITTGEKEGLELQKGQNINVERNTMKIFVNDVEVDADNFVYNETTYVPLRKISEMFKREVDWERLSNTATIGTKGIGFFDGKVLGTFNDIEYTDYMYEYYKAMYEAEYEYYEGGQEHPLTILGTCDEYVINHLKNDYALIDYALKNGMSMTPIYNASYYDTVKSTLKGVNGDMERFDRMLEMQGFTSLNSYYYAMLTSDLFVQYALGFEEQITEDEIREFYESNEQLSYEYSYAESFPDILRILCQEKATESISEMAKNVVHKVK